MQADAARSSLTRFLPKILPNLPRLCRPSFGQDLTQDMARSQPPGKILASCQDLALLGKNLAQELFAGWRRSCPLLVGGWVLASNHSGGHCYGSLVPILPHPVLLVLRAASRLLVLCVGAEVRVLCRLARDGNQSTVHLLGVVVGLEALNCHKLLLSGGALCCSCGCLHLAFSLWDARIIMASSNF